MIDFEAIKKEYDSLTQELTNPELISQWGKFQALSKRRALLEKILKRVEELEELQKRIEENVQIISSGEDADLISLTQGELVSLEEQKKKIEKELEELVAKKDFSSSTALILEIRAGTGGEEAALFAKDLFEMYTRFAKKQGWKQTLINLNPTDLGGIKEAAVEIEGEDVFEKLQYEGGVHRVQRIPETEKSGRIHTSTASVAVLPKPSETEIKLNPKDLKIEFKSSSGPGGQNVNKRQTAVRITHIPTGIVVESQATRTQQQNRELAMRLLLARIFEKEKEKKEKELAKERRAQIKFAKRAEKIRTYNFPQDRVTDHRIEKSWHGIEDILEGELDDIIKSLHEFQPPHV